MLSVMSGVPFLTYCSSPHYVDSWRSCLYWKVVRLCSRWWPVVVSSD